MNPTPLKQYRKDNRLKLEEMGEKLGVHKTTIFRWEEELVRIPAERVSEISKVTGIPRSKLRSDLFGRAGAA